MKILKHGFRKPPKLMRYRWECERCGCLFEYTYEDLTVEWHFKYGGGRKQGEGVLYCPDCGMRIPVTEVFGFEIEEDKNDD